MSCCRGFTLLELVTIILLLGIVTVYVLGRAGGSFKAVAETEELLQAIRLTQERAMHHTGDGQPYQITIGGGGYSLSFTPAAMYAETLDGSLEASVSPTGVIAFDGRGAPLCSAGLDCAASRQQFHVTAAGKTEVLTLQPYTGYVSR
jgi:type II secretory pathway pseudopilin PulG